MFAVQEPKLAAVTSLIQLLYCCAFGHQTADGSHNIIIMVQIIIRKVGMMAFVQAVKIL